MSIRNYSTSIAAEKTASEIQRILARAKVDSTWMDYDPDGTPRALGFALKTPGGRRDFKLPVNVDGMLAVLRADKSIRPQYRDRAQATRVAWRNTKDWIDAQLALIQAGMATIDEVMLPWMLTDADTTIYQRYVEKSYLELEHGEDHD